MPEPPILDPVTPHTGAGRSVVRAAGANSSMRTSLRQQLNRRVTVSAVEPLERRRLLAAAAGPTTAAAIDDLVAPGDALVSTAVQVGPSWSYFFARDAA